MNQNSASGYRLDPSLVRAARLDSCQLTSTSDSPPGQLHVGDPARASAPVPAESRSRSLRRSHPVGAALDRPASFLHPLSPSHGSTRNSGERRPGPDWVGSSQILQAAPVPEPSLAAPRRPARGSRPSAGPALRLGRVTALPAAPTVQPTRPRRQRPLLTLPHRSPRSHAAQPLASAAPQPKALSPRRPAGHGRGRTPSGPQLPRMRRARRALPGPSEAWRSELSVSGALPAPLAPRDARAAGSFGGVAESAVSQAGAPRPTPPPTLHDAGAAGFSRALE